MSRQPSLAALTFVVLSIAGSGACDAHAQQVVRLGAPTARLAEEFTRVAGVREESNGRVILVDSREQRIVRADLTSGTITPLGRAGRGPGEYTLPLDVHGWTGDTTFVTDMDGMGRAVVITTRGTESHPLRGAKLRDGDPIYRVHRIGFDARGRLYSGVWVTRTAGGPPTRLDSIAIERYDRATGQRDTLAWVANVAKSPLLRSAAPRVPSSGPIEAPRSGGALPPFMTRDQWAVAADGRVAVVTVDPYRVTFHSGNGRPVTGPALAFTPVKVTGAEKQAWRDMQTQPTVGLMYANNTVRPIVSRPSFTEPAAWPDVLPAFLDKAISFAPDGDLWVQRAVAAAKPPLFDVIDRTGRVTKQVELPMRTRLVGFGARSIYLVRIDENDLETLERYALP